MSISNQPLAHEKLTIIGDVASSSFVPWIRRHARKLGLQGQVSTVTPQRIELDVTGPIELVDALEMGCSLGPIDVWIDSILREPLSQDLEGSLAAKARFD